MSGYYKRNWETFPTEQLKRVDQPPDIFSQGDGNEPGCGIRHHAHGVADPVISTECLVCSVILVNENGNGMGMIQLQGSFSCIYILKIEPMTINGICREFAYSNGIRPQKISRFLDMTCYRFIVIRQGGFAPSHVPIPERPHIIPHPGDGTGNWMLGDKSSKFFL